MNLPLWWFDVHAGPMLEKISQLSRKLKVLESFLVQFQSLSVQTDCDAEKLLTISF